MKLAGARAAAFCRAPETGLAGALLHGPDPGLLSLRRRELVAALVGSDPMRLVRLEPEAVRRDPAALDEALKARGFFVDRQALLIEGAKDALAELLRPLLPGLGPEDAFLVVTATGLTPRSALRKLFEGDRRLAALGLYPDPPGAAEIAERLARAGGPRRIEPEAARRLAERAAALDPGSFERFLEALALYAGEAEALTGADVAALAPQAAGDVDALVAAVAEADTARIGPLLARLTASGTRPDSAVSAVSRHFRQLFRLAAHPEGPAAAIGGLKGPKRDALLAQARRWPLARLEPALRHLAETERRLRSPGAKPEAALAERCLLRLAGIGARPRG